MKQSGRTKATNEYAKRVLEVAGNPATLEEAICNLVSELLRDATVPPTNLDELKGKLDIVKIVAEDTGLSGELRRERKGLHIVYSSHLAIERRRFTIAHEMGHALLNKLGQRLPHSGPDVERLCDKFAAEILMPRDAFLERLGSSLTIECLFDLKRAFEVSLSAIAYRCFELRRDSVFEIDRGTVSWGAGLVTKGPFHRIETGLRLGINEAYEKEKGNAEVYFVDRGQTYRGELEWSTRSQEKTLFILRRSNNNELVVTATGF